jgi:hypothetical protein
MGDEVNAYVEGSSQQAPGGAVVLRALQRLRADLRGVLDEQERIAAIEDVPLVDGKASSVGLRGQAAGRRAVCAALRAVLKAADSGNVPETDDVGRVVERCRFCKLPWVCPDCDGRPVRDSGNVPGEG